MADSSDSDQEKTEEPTTQRIDEFRKRGEVASSKELNSVLVLSACVLTLALGLVYMYEVMGGFVEWLYALDIRNAFTEKSYKTIVWKTASVALKTAAPVALVALVVGIIATVAQIGFMFSPEVLEFKPERVNPFTGTKNLFSMKSLVEAIKGIFKFAFILSIVYFSMKDEVNSYQGYFHVGFAEGIFHARWVIAKLAFSIIIGLIIIALADFTYQKMSYRKKLMMTKDELKRESKEQDGNPEVKQKIRTIQREMAQKRMMDDVKSADVIVTNPTHLSLALKYDKETMISPALVAKGSDHLALRIREIAKENNIPIVENVPLARAMFKTIKVGGIIPRNLYKAVAEVLAFVYKLKKKEKAIG